MSRAKTLLVSLPWADYSSPSYPLSHLSAYAKQRGFHVDLKHLHLNIAISVGLKEYDSLSLSYNDMILGESLCISILFPEMEYRVVSKLKKRIPHIKRLRRKFHDAFIDALGEIHWKDYRLFGMTLNHGQLFASLLAAAWAKQQNPNIIIMLGGAPIFPEMARSFLSNFKQIDYILEGEGETPFVTMLEQLSSGHMHEKNTPGLFYRNSDDITCNPITILDDLSNFPDPDFEGYFESLENKRSSEHEPISACIPIEVVRGCKNRCVFCCYHGFAKNIRLRPVAEVAASISRMNTKYKSTSIALIAPEIPSDYGNALFDMLKSHGRNYRIFCEARAGIKKDLLGKMKQAGVCEVQIGIESLSSSVLSKMNKGTLFIDNLQSMKHCEELGIRNSGNLIINYPTITKKEMNQSYDRINYVWPYMPLAYSNFTLFHNTIAFKHPHKYKIDGIENSKYLSSLLPLKKMEPLSLPYIDFSTKHKMPTTVRLRKRVDEWEGAYYKSLLSGRPLLFYSDCGDFLTIEDHRFGKVLITLTGLGRDLYLFCDSAQPLQSIIQRFANSDHREIKGILSTLCRLKVMYSESGMYLSLAIHYPNTSRKNMPSL